LWSHFTCLAFEHPYLYKYFIHAFSIQNTHPMRDLKELQQFWRHHQDVEKFLCTIIGKTGSGYRESGAKKIILGDGTSCGYLSGGCLEGDIIRTALERQNDMPFVKSFSTMSREDRLMGYQTGCAGIIEILFEKLPEGDGDMHRYIPFGDRDDIAGIAISTNRKTLALRTILSGGNYSDDVFVDPWIKPFKLYVLGCGGNARPFAEIAPPLGWEVNFLDYREGHVIENSTAVQSRILALDQFYKHIDEGEKSAVIVMTHNYEADLDLIGQLNGKNYGYLGFVGPKKRFEQLCADSKNLCGIEINMDWAENIHAPAGTYKGRTPEDIAFSIISQIQMKLHS